MNWNILVVGGIIVVSTGEGTQKCYKYKCIVFNL